MLQLGAFSNGPSALEFQLGFSNLALNNRVYSGQASISNTDYPTSVKPRTLVATVKRHTQEMTSTEIEEIIKTELQVEPDITNVFGLDLTKCLIKPTRQKYKNANDSTDIYELWTVLEETEDRNGYKIYFDEDSKMFGLAIKSDKDELIDIGGYGNFLKTLYSM